jgi:hypothetical protein
MTISSTAWKKTKVYPMRVVVDDPARALTEALYGQRLIMQLANRHAASSGGTPMKFLASVLTLAASVALLPAGLAQVSAGNAKPALNSLATVQAAGQLNDGVARAKKPLPSPPAQATVELSGKQITIDYSAPSMRGRKIFGGLLPYDHWWRTGANAATTLTTPIDLKIGTATVPAGTYTLYSLPSETTWKLIINKQTKQWGTVYNESQDLARVDMQKNPLPDPQEKMSISFENTQGNRTQLHVRWENTDVWVPVVAQ